MVKINKVTTKSGDDGNTSMFGSGRVRKNSVRMEAIGSIDELMAQLGMLRSLEEISIIPKAPSILSQIQNDLFDLGSELAASSGTKSPCPIKKTHIFKLERISKSLNKSLPVLNSFILPGGSVLNSWIHLARADTRKAERAVVRFMDEYPLNPLLQVYLNRLSDLLFILARSASHYQKAEEILWVPGGVKNKKKLPT